jgi:hypothetical protein
VSILNRIKHRDLMSSLNKETIKSGGANELLHFLYEKIKCV